MNQILNDEKHIILTKREYDKLEERANGAIERYDNEIKELKEKIAHIEKEKPYIRYDLSAFSLYGSSYSITYVENSEDEKVIKMFDKKIESLKENFKKEILEMSVLDFLRKKRDLKKRIKTNDF